MNRFAHLLAVVLAVAVAETAAAQSQIADPHFDVRIDRPAYREQAPVVVIDQAHANNQTSTGTYEPFARLLRRDGYRVLSGQRRFASRNLAGVDILVIANAGAAATDRPALSEAEAEAVRRWVRRGGALLFVADHRPFGRAARNLAARFGVGMGNGWVAEPQNAPPGLTTQIVYTSEAGLGDHIILRGRDTSERVSRLRAFTGQSLSPPPGATALMTLPRTAFEVSDPQHLDRMAEAIAGGSSFEAAARAIGAQPVGQRLQGLAFEYGAGRVVVLGEAGMLSAQVATLPANGTTRTIKLGMNVPGYDNRQFALNLMHWLSRLLN
jgi:hypothetical protein